MHRQGGRDDQDAAGTFCIFVIISVVKCSSYFAQDKAGCKMQMIQDGPFSQTPEKPLRMSGSASSCEVRMFLSLSLCVRACM